MDSRSAAVASRECPFQALGFGEPKRPFLFDDIVGGYIGSVTYAATSLCAAAGPILCSEAHIPPAKTVTDRTLPKSACFPRRSLGPPPGYFAQGRSLAVILRSRGLVAGRPVRGVRLHAHASSSLTPMLFLSDARLHGSKTTATNTSEMNMIRRLFAVGAIAAVALALIRLSAQRASRRATDEAANAEWESEGGSSAAASRGSVAPSA
jgi:hypothetical protein